MKKDFSLTPQQLQDGIQNTIRVFNEYKLDRKMYANNTYKIATPSGEFYQYQFLIIPGGTQLSMTVGSRGYKMTEQKAIGLVSQFFSRLDQVINGQIILTAEIVNRDVYKSSQNLIGAINLVRLVVAVIATIMALMLLLR